MRTGEHLVLAYKDLDNQPFAERLLTITMHAIAWCRPRAGRFRVYVNRRSDGRFYVGYTSKPVWQRRWEHNNGYYGYPPDVVQHLFTALEISVHDECAAKNLELTLAWFLELGDLRPTMFHGRFLRRAAAA